MNYLSSLQLPDYLADTVNMASDLIPRTLDFLPTLLFVGFLCGFSIFAAVVFKFLFGPRSSVNCAVCSALGILLVYIATICIYSLRPGSLERLLSPLPFVAFLEDYLVFYTFSKTTLPVLCSHLLSLIVLAFVVNLADSIIPQGHNPIIWLITRGLSLVFAMVLHLVFNWALQTFFPDVVARYAPEIIIILLLITMVGGLINVVCSLLLAISNPVLAVFHAFFFSHIIGKQISKAVLSSLVLCGLFWVAKYFGYTMLALSPVALLSYLPLLLCVLIIWYIISKKI